MHKCPWCDQEIEDEIHQAWVDDYPVNFDLECPECGEKIEIDVEAEPIFYAHKKD